MTSLAGHPGDHRHAAAGRAVADGVVDQVVERLAHAGRVEHDGGVVGVDRQRRRRPPPRVRREAASRRRPARAARAARARPAAGRRWRGPAPAGPRRSGSGARTSPPPNRSASRSSSALARRRQGGVDLGAEDRQRRSQLVAGVAPRSRARARTACCRRSNAELTVVGQQRQAGVAVRARAAGDRDGAAAIAAASWLIRRSGRSAAPASSQPISDETTSAAGKRDRKQRQQARQRLAGVAHGGPDHQVARGWPCDRGRHHQQPRRLEPGRGAVDEHRPALSAAAGADQRRPRTDRVESSTAAVGREQLRERLVVVGEVAAGRAPDPCSAPRPRAAPARGRAGRGRPRLAGRSAPGRR